MKYWHFCLTVFSAVLLSSTEVHADLLMKPADGEQPQSEDTISEMKESLNGAIPELNEEIGDNPEALQEIPMVQMIQGKAVIKGTAADSPIQGTVKLMETDVGLVIDVDVHNVPNPGDHGFHIHENGSCEDGGKAAGGHFNPHQTEHGLLAKDGKNKAHAGDMGNITIDEKGSGHYSGILPGVSLVTGNVKVNGKAVILHEKKDDFGQPTGNAGGRIGCGIIEVLN